MPEPIDIIILGTGSAVPTPERRHPAILMHFGSEYILFDCGEGTQTQLVRAKISPMKITRIFITHWHGDHFAGLLPLIETLHLERRNYPLEVYGPEASRFVDTLVELSYWGVGFDVRGKDCEPGQKIFENDSFEISTIRVKHSVPAVGYCIKERDHWHIDVKKAKKLGLEGKILRQLKERGKIKVGKNIIQLKQVAKMTPGRKIVYSGDTMISKDLFEIAKGADLLIHDATFTDASELKSHSPADEVAKWAKKYKIKKLVLTHFSRKCQTEKEILKVVKPIFKTAIIAKDLMRIRI